MIWAGTNQIWYPTEKSRRVQQSQYCGMVWTKRAANRQWCISERRPWRVGWQRMVGCYHLTFSTPKIRADLSLKGTASSGPMLRSGIVWPKHGSPKKMTVATNSGLERTAILITMFEVWASHLRIIQSSFHPSMVRKGLLRFFSDRICWRESPMTWNLGLNAWKAIRQSFLQILWLTGSLGILKDAPKIRQFLNFCCVLLCF